MANELANELRTKLKEGVVTFKYIKTNGEERLARGTLNENMSEDLANYVASGTRVIPGQLVAYWDLDKNAWRTLRVEKIVAIY